MLKKLTKVVALSFFTIISIQAPLYGQIPSSGELALKRLDQSNQNRFFKKGWVQILLDSKDGPWPDNYMYSILTVTPFEAMAIFSDFASHKDFVPDMIKSDVVKTGDNGSKVQVSFKLDMPWPFPDSYFTMEDSLNQYVGGVYDVTWTQVKSDASEKSDGHARFYPYKDGKTLLEYHSVVVPNSSLAFLVERQAMKEAKRAMLAVRDHINGFKEKFPGKIKKNLSSLAIIMKKNPKKKTEGNKFPISAN